MSDIIGRGFAFPPQIDSQGKLALTGNESEISQAIHVILNTAPGERIMRPDFGCRIHELVFEPNTEETHAKAARFVREALNMWEPRIDLQDVKVRADTENMGMIQIEITYTIKGDLDPRALVYPFYILPDQP
ncbi:MAG: baseplate protein [Phototrophicales bacterium]|nr:MAG: baseplate protein [Phototrophicales bacterium]